MNASPNKYALCALAVVGLAVLAPLGHAAITVGGEPVEVVDAHLHTGQWANQPVSAKAFLAGVQPPAFQLYAPALTDAILSPYHPHVGVRAQTDWAQVDHAVLYATYTHHTVGYLSNAALSALLEHPANDGWAWGFASINLDGIWDEDIRRTRTAALASHLEAHPDRFIGIKLAHAHQQVALDDEVMQDIYDVAAQYGVPVLLHTGFSPFPNTSDEPRYYDPAYLENMVSRYDGRDGGPRVDFILSHVGQGDARAIASALRLARDYANVWLEISALSGPLRLDETGQPSSDTEPQYKSVVQRIRAAGLVDRTIFGSDGPQYSGKVRSYVQDLVDEMVAVGYELEEIRAVMAGNFHRLFRTGQ